MSLTIALVYWSTISWLHYYKRSLPALPKSTVPNSLPGEPTCRDANMLLLTAWLFLPAFPSLFMAHFRALCGCPLLLVDRLSSLSYLQDPKYLVPTSISTPWTTPCFFSVLRNTGLPSAAHQARLSLLIFFSLTGALLLRSNCIHSSD